MNTRKMGACWSLAVQTVISGVIMYLVMFVMIGGLDFYNNLNMLYMTLMMVAPMVMLMILAMRHMLPVRPPLALIAASLVAFFSSFAHSICTQTTIGDTAFLRSMIPHHSGAILMCRKQSQRSGSHPALRSDRRSQRQEIDEMKAILARR
jgi:hypothetical protein